MCLSIVAVALKYNGQQFPSTVSDRDLPEQFKRHGQWPRADWLFFFFQNILLFCLSPLRNWDSSILTCQLFPLFSFQVAYYSRRDFCIPDPHPGHAVSPQVEVPCLDAERHSGECLFTRVHWSLADTDARGILHFQWHLFFIKAVCFQKSTSTWQGHQCWECSIHSGPHSVTAFLVFS